MTFSIRLYLLIAGLLTVTTIAKICSDPVSAHRRGTLEISKKGCIPKTVDVNVCDGYCSSITYPDFEHGAVKMNLACHGCVPKSVNRRKVWLQCGSQRKPEWYSDPTECECKKFKTCEIGSRKKRSTNETDLDMENVESKTGLP
jgi:hypothetical protein